MGQPRLIGTSSLKREKNASVAHRRLLTEDRTSSINQQLLVLALDHNSPPNRWLVEVLDFDE